jgi:glycosyltransferase involved in cell wall biosynthesis
MKRICFISDKNIVMKKICNFLAENNFEIHIICRHYDGLNKKYFHQDIVFHQLTSQSLIIKYFQINRIINQIKPDIIHLHQIAKDSIIPIFRFRRKYKYYITIWGSDINLYSKNIVNKVCQNIGLIFCDKIQLLSPYFEEKIRRTFFGIKRSKLILLPWGIDYDFFLNCSKIDMVLFKSEYKIGENDLIVLSFRNFKELYNLVTLVKAIPTVSKKYPDSRFVFVRGTGDKKYIQKNKDLIKELNVKDNFIFIDKYIDQEELKVMINASHISINIPFKDGLPASLLEIMATGSIPIVSDLENYHPLIKNNKNGFYLKNLEDHIKLAELIINALDNIQYLQQRFAKLNNEYIKEYQNWKIQCEKLLEFYNS